MRRIKDCLRLRFESGLNQKQISGSLRIARSTVQDYLKRFDRVKLEWSHASSLSDSELENRLFPSFEKTGDSRPEPDYAYIHRELRRKGVTLQLLWEEYISENPTGYRTTQFCERYNRWRDCLKVFMRQYHKGGEKIFVDYSGKRPSIVDRHTGEIKPVELFVMTWGASNYTYAESHESQAFANWAMGHVRGFEYFDCVSKITVPDNLKSGVNKACRYDPDINRAYSELADHYGFAVLPARPSEPKDKAKVEVGVQIVQRWILARLRDRIFYDIEHLNQAIWELLADLNNRLMQKIKRSRLELFKEVDYPNAKHLPLTPYVYREWEQHTMGLDYHVEVDKHYYSYPYKLYRKKRKVDVRLTEMMVEIYYKNDRIASHARSQRKYGYTTETEHMPERHRSLLDQTPARVIAWAEKMGPFTGRLIENLIASKTHPEQGVRPALGILRLAKTVSEGRLENAARIACAHSFYRVRQIKEILKKRLDEKAVPEKEKGTVENTTNIRGSQYYQQSIFETSNNN